MEPNAICTWSDEAVMQLAVLLPGLLHDRHVLGMKR